MVTAPEAMLPQRTESAASEVELLCPGCAVALRIPATAATQRIQCPACRLTFEGSQATRSASPDVVPAEMVPGDTVAGAGNPQDLIPGERVLNAASSMAVSSAPRNSPPPIAASAAQDASRWRLRTPEMIDYGPVDRETLERWVREGRVTGDCEVCVAGTNLWRRADVVFPVLDESRVSRPVPPAAPPSAAWPAVPTTAAALPSLPLATAPFASGPVAPHSGTYSSGPPPGQYPSVAPHSVAPYSVAPYSETSAGPAGRPGMWPERRDTGGPSAAAASATTAMATAIAGSYLPHRGPLIVALGVIGLLTTCPIFSVMAWVMGSNDLEEMARGRLDPAGLSTTKIGRMLGMVMSILWIALAVITTISLLYAAYL